MTIMITQWTCGECYSALRETKIKGVYTCCGGNKKGVLNKTHVNFIKTNNG